MVIDEVALDTNIAIAFLNGDKPTIELIENATKIYLPITVVGELLFGAMNSNRSTINLPKFQQLIDNCELLNINELIANEYAKVRLKLKKIGKPIPENDIWIAATCKVNDIALATRDKHLSFVENLNVISL